MVDDKIVKAFCETDMGSFRYQAIEGEAPINKQALKKMPKSLKKYVATLWDGTKIYIVDGKWIRDNVDVAFVGGTHPLEAGWMPKKELFIEDCKDPGDMIFLLLHEMVEYIQMSLVKTKYEKSHDISNSCEHAARAMAQNRREVKMLSRITSLFIESPIFQDTHLDMGTNFNNIRDSLEEIYKDCKSSGQLIGKTKLGNIHIELFIDDITYYVFAFNNRVLVGNLIATKNQKRKYPTAISSVVSNDYQRQGIGMSMYDLLIQNTGGLYSDRTLTGKNKGGSFRVWEKLSQKYNGYLLTAPPGSKSYNIDKVAVFTKDMITNPNDALLITIKPVALQQPAKVAAE